MLRLLLIVFIIAVLGLSGYFFVFNKPGFSTVLTNQKAQIAQNPVKQTGNQAVKQPVVATDQAIDDDMTALDQDLADINKMDTSFAGDLNGI